MRPAVRIALVVVGLAIATHGVASLTGRWRGTPPWWERAAPMTPGDWMRRYHPDDLRAMNENEDWNGGYPKWLARWDEAESAGPAHVEPVPGRESLSGGIVATGLVLAALGAWPRRRPERVA